MSETASTSGFPCRQCGANLEFVPGTTHIKCPFCTTENQIQAEGRVTEQDFGAVLAGLEKAAPHAEHRTIRCQACAAEVEVPANITSMACCFCGTNIVSQVVCSSRVLPHGVLPFGITREQAVTGFRRWVASLWFAPSRLKRESLIEANLHGVYLPTWTYDCRTDTRYVGERGDAYYVLVLASDTLPRAMVQNLEPWDLKAALPYRDEYLAGFRAETYQVDLKGGWGLAQAIMAPRIDDAIRADIGGDEQRIHQRHVTYSDVTFKHLLVPVWVSAYRFRGKAYRFLVNARTGEVQGERPWSVWKISLAITAGVIVVGFFILLVARS
jgi:LSD1 subclass zinc finger protein